jgi:hypothetical protein
MERLVECITVFGRDCKVVNKLSYEKIKEDYHVDLSKVKIQTIDSVKGTVLKETNLCDYDKELFTEAIKEAEEKGFTLWEFPISRYNYKNANGRDYPKQLWERVIKEQRDIWQGGVGLANHPRGDDDGDFKESAIVWLDMRLDESGLVYGLGSFVGPYGKLAEDILVRKGKIGFSSSGFGDLLQDKCTVDPKTYLIERCADIVLNPSQKVFGTLANKKETVASNVTENNTNLSSTIKEEKTMAEKVTNIKVSKLEEKRIRKDILSFLEDSDKIMDPDLRLQELNDILASINEGIASDLKEEVEKKISSLKEEIKKGFNEVKILKDDLGVENTAELKESLITIAEQAELLKEDSKDWSSIVTILQEKIKKLSAALNSRPTSLYVEKLLQIKEEEKKDVEKNVKQLQKELSDNIEEIKEAKSINHKLNKELAMLKAQLIEATKTNALIEGQVERLQKRAQEAEDCAKEKEEELEDYKKEVEESGKAKLMPSFKERVKGQGAMNFDETEKVESYWNDVHARHGECIEPFEDKIKGCKTLNEAMRAYFKVISKLDENYTSARLPESVSINKKERIEKLNEAGMNIEEGPTTISSWRKRGYH